ncbi:MAG: hypothetical protein Q4G59_01620, partial [Planctomycetia bacterium]|nr:hypothetical protein [Planctomycetia bacterium]
VIDTDGLGRNSWFFAGTYSPASYTAQYQSAASAAADSVFSEPEELLNENIPVEEIAQAHCSKDTSTGRTSDSIDFLVLSDDITRKNKIFMGAFTE